MTLYLLANLRAGTSLLLLLSATLAAAPLRAAPVQAPQTLYNFSLVQPGGGILPLSAYKGKVVVIVNLASKSGFADQLPGLEKLQEQYKDQGLVVLGVPSNDFGAEEPDDDAATQKFYAAQHVTFPVLGKSAVSGKDALPVYRFLTALPHATKSPTAAGPEATEASAGPGSEVHWSYTKFIVTREGQVGARFEPDVAPDSPAFQIAIDKALAGKLKPGAKPAKASGGADEDDDDDGGF